MDKFSRVSALAVVSAGLIFSGRPVYGQMAAGPAGSAIGQGAPAASAQGASPAGRVASPSAGRAAPSVGRVSPAGSGRINAPSGQVALANGPMAGRVAPSGGAVRNGPVQTVTGGRGQLAPAREAYLQPQGVRGVVPSRAVSPRIGFTSRSSVDNGAGRERGDHREHPRRRYASFYNSGYPGYFGSADGGYGYPYLYVQTYGYPFSALPFQQTEAAGIYNEPQVSDDAETAPAEATPAAAAPEAEQQPDSLVQDVQSELIRRGYLAGKATGLVTADFQTALRRFQTDQNLASSGLINQASLYALGLN